MKRIFLLFFLIVSFQFLFGQESKSDLDSLAMKQAKALFKIGDVLNTDGNFISYDNNVLILLQGFPTKEDSSIVCELIYSLNVLVDKWEVLLIPNGTANLTVNINLPHEGKWKNHVQQNYNSYQIISSNIYLDLPEDADYNTRKKVYYYNILRSMVVFNEDQKNTITIPGSVFTENDPQKITFNPIDFKIIKAVYSKADVSKQSSSDLRKSILMIANYSRNIFAHIFAILVSLVFMISVFQSEFVKKHYYGFKAFFNQGLWVILAYIIYNSLKTIITLLFIARGYVHLDITLYFSLSFVVVGILSIILIYWIEKPVLKNRENIFLEVSVPMLTTIAVPIIISLIVLFICDKFFNMKEFAANGYSLTVQTLSLTTLLGIARAFYIYTSKKTENLIRKKDLELAKISELHKQAELQSLRAKINPHFLYNALNSIASLATTDARKTEQMALALSDFFKYAINREQKQLNTLSEELNAVRTYLEIEKVRFGDRLSFEIDCPEELQNIQIPQLLIQPLVENAIKHGLSQITENGLIRIVVAKEKAQLEIRIYDNGPAFPEGPLSGFGIQNTQERIALLYGAKATINWRNGAEKYIEISLPVGS